MRIGDSLDAAMMLNVSTAKVHKWAREGQIPTLTRIGRRYRFDLDALADWTPPLPTRRRRRTRTVAGRMVLSDETIARLPTKGWAYFIQAKQGGPVKIGMAVDVDERIRTLQFSCPFELVLRGQIAGGRQAEARLHKRFARHRLHGEWFNQTAPGLDAEIRKAGNPHA